MDAAPAEQFHSACASFSLEGAPVTVKNEAGTIIGAGTTSTNIAPSPTPMPADEQQGGANYASQKAADDLDAYFAAEDSCSVTVQLTVPRAQFYQIQVGTHGAPTYSFEQLQGMNWKVSLSLGL